MFLHPDHLVDKLGFQSIRRAAVEAARSVIGREQLEKLIPSSDAVLVERQLKQTAEMMDLLQNEAGFPLNNIHDLRTYLSISGAEGSILSLEAFLETLEMTVTTRRVKSFINNRKEPYPELQEISIGLIPLKDMEEAIKRVITEQGELRNDASPELQSIRRRLSRKRNELRSTINRAMSRAAKEGMTSDEGPTIRSGRMVIPIQAEYKRKIQGFVHDVSSSGQTVYLEPVEALNINNEIRQLESEEKREIERILRQLTGQVRRHRDSLRQNLEVLGRLDVIAARADVGIKMNAFVPVLSESAHLYLVEAYNPILLLKNLEQPKDQKENIVPLNMELTEQEQCLVVTGPNAGGKSVAIKTLGLCVMMAQCGFAIPARDSTELPVYSGLFVDMGDDQSIENDLSTFSSRLQWMKTTLAHADENSLVLIDEAAAGTDPEEGGALFQSLMELLMERRSKVLVTTHHGSLKVFAHDHPHSVNGSMEFDQATLSPTYQFKKGIPGSSYAFEIAQRMQVDASLLEKARDLLGEAKGNMETLITELEAKTQEAKELKERYDRLKAETTKARNRYEEKRSAIEKEKETIREKALIEAKEIMQSANQRIEEAVEQITLRGNEDKEAIGEVRKGVEKHKQEVNRQLNQLKTEKQQRAEENGQPPEIGDAVRLQDANTTGELVEISGDNAVVLSGGLKLKTKYKNLIRVKGRGQKEKKNDRITVNMPKRNTGTVIRARLDIRGRRGPDAIKEVTHYLDNVLASGLNQVEIIHGKGEGILKKLVHEYLEQRPEVRDFNIAPLNQGGSGCTIVKL